MKNEFLAENKALVDPFEGITRNFEKVYDVAPDMIIRRDRDGRFTYANEQYQKYVNLTESEIIGKTVSDILFYAKEAAEAITQVDKMVIADKQIVRERIMLPAPDGKERYFEVLKSPLYENDEVVGITGVFRDISAQKAAIDKIAQQSKLMETLNKVSAFLLEPEISEFELALNRAMDLIAAFVQADVIDIWKKRSETDLRKYELSHTWSADSSEKNNFNPGSVITVRKAFFKWDDALVAGESVQEAVCDMNSEAKRIFRERGIMSVIASPIIVNDMYWGYITAYDRRNSREFSDDEQMLLRLSGRIVSSAIERSAMTNALVNQTALLESALKAKSNFLAKMSHEIRTPMNAIIGMTELALRENLPDTALEHITTVKHAGESLLAIINDILDISKIESGTTDIAKSNYHLSSLISDVISIVRMRLSNTHVRFIVNVESKLPSVLIGDESKIRQVLINLLSNAIKYTTSGFVKLTVDGIMDGEKKLKLRVRVEDSGVGIAPEDFAGLFDEYIRGQTQNSMSTEGVGLGLAISNGFVEAMGGKIDVESALGIGSTFTVTIPQEVSDATKIAEVEKPEEKSTLLYERRTELAKSLIESINDLGVECDLAVNYEEFYEKLRNKSYAYIMGSAELLTMNKAAIDKYAKTSQVILTAEFGEPVGSEGIILSMPAHAVSIANAYNEGKSELSSTAFRGLSERLVLFTAPTARILVVDDISTNLKVARGLLAPYDVRVDLATGGREAIDAIEVVDYDLVFMDHRMPGMDGIEATQIIRSLSKQKKSLEKLPIVALTANVVAGMREMFLDAGLSDFLAKPIDTVLLDDILRRWLPAEKQNRYIPNRTAHERAMEELRRIDEIDIKRGITLTGGTTAGFLEILSTLVDDAGEYIKELTDDLYKKDVKLYTMYVHALKSALSFVGATQLSATAARLEAAGSDGDIAYIETVGDKFNTELSIVVEKVKNALRHIDEDSEEDVNVGDNTLTTDTKISAAGDAGTAMTSEFANVLKLLRNAIVDMDAGTMNNASDELLKLARGKNKGAAEDVKRISQSILLADYNEAIKVIDSLL